MMGSYPYSDSYAAGLDVTVVVAVVVAVSMAPYTTYFCSLGTGSLQMSSLSNWSSLGELECRKILCMSIRLSTKFK